MEFGPAEVMRILAVTDALGIHREAVRVPLDNQGAGAVRLVREGRMIEIVAPAEGDFDAWVAALPTQIRELDLSRVKLG